MNMPNPFSIRLSVLLLLLVLQFESAEAKAVIAMKGDRVEISSWIDARFSRGSGVPFSFRLDGVPSSEFLGSWKRVCRITVPDDSSALSRTYTWSDESTGLAVICEVTGYPQSDVVEWVLRFRNLSGGNSGRISEVKVAGLGREYPASGPVSLH